MKIHNNYSLKILNAFHVDVFAKHFVKIESTSGLQTILSDPRLMKEKKYIVGEGSGTFFTKDFNGIVILNCIKGIKIIKTTKKHVVVEVGSGVIWDDFAKWTVNNNLSGIENMSFIPGTVGAAPIQNIAAFGQNQGDAFVSLVAVNLKTGSERVFDKNDCEFKYRDSVFKKELKNKYFITKLTYRLSSIFSTDTTYYSRFESLENELKRFTEKPYNLKDVREAVKRIRTRKFPNWKKNGNTGSYFLNPFITADKLKQIQIKYPDVQYYPTEKMLYPELANKKLADAKMVKLAAGWLLDEIGWKGKRAGKVGTSPSQALVIVNYGGASAKEILDFADKMNKDFQKHFGVKLEPEVNIV